MLLLHGTADNSVPCENAVAFSTLLKVRAPSVSRSGCRLEMTLSQPERDVAHKLMRLLTINSSMLAHDGIRV